ncbi:MAG: DNA topoisomerase 3 [Christensenellales bacterium]
MSKTLIIAEKPSVARDIARVLGAKTRGDGFIYSENHVVSWALGHLVALCDPGEMNPAWQKWSFETLPMLPDDMQTKIIPRTKGQFATLKKLMASKEVADIICATDSGREGELIFRLIYNMAACKKPVQRLWISSMTDEAIKEGFATLRPLSHYDNLYKSAKCRSEADWLVGMNASRAFTLKYGLRLSVGRVQTPTLAILAKRRSEIENFKPVEYYEIEALHEDFSALWYDETGDTTRLGDAAEAKAISAKLRGKTAVIKKVETERKQVAAPQLYDLTALQRDANIYFGFPAAKTLKVAQSLYETRKLITYPRTDSRYLPKDMAPKARAALSRMRGEYAELAKPLLQENLPQPAKIFNDEKVSDHHAIIITERSPQADLTADEQRIYDLVARRLIAAFYPPYKYDSTKIIAHCEGEALISRGTKVAESGWREVYKNLSKKEKDNILPDVNEGDARTITKASAKKKATKPPSPHNEATLLSAMENAGREIDDPALKESMKDSGLGTPATRAAIIERLIEVGYVQRKGKALNATDKGMSLIAISPSELSSPETTGKWEKALKSISDGKMDDARFMGSISRFAAFLVDYAKSSAPDDAGFEKEERVYKNSYVAGVVCPLCQSKVVETAAAFSCSKWREGCKFTVWKNCLERRGGPLIDKKSFLALMKEGRASLKGGTATLSGTLVSFKKEDVQGI